MWGCRPLADSEAHVWYVFPETATRPELLLAYRELLAAEERAQQQRFRLPETRQHYLVAHALVRTTLSRYVDVDPRRWVFARNRYGRPEIAAPRLRVPLRFNLSHTDGLIACAVVQGLDVGIDVENHERRHDALEIADQFFSPAEVTALHALPAEAQRRRFFEYWTLKESYIKARGMGLSLALNRFSFDVRDGEPIRISFDPCLADDPAAWQFALWRPTSRHVMALSVRRGPSPDLHIDVRPTVPLVS